MRLSGMPCVLTDATTGDLIIEHVSALAAAGRWDVKELYAEAGRLDDVFRSLTTQDTQRARERRAGAVA